MEGRRRPGHPVRTLALAIRVNASAPLKFALLVALVATATLVFLGVQELSRASTSDLDTALDGDLGATGSYLIQPTPELGLPLPDLLARVRNAIEPIHPTTVQVVQKTPTLHPECPPYDTVGQVTAGVLLNAAGNPIPFPQDGSELLDSDLCLAGLVIPRASLREATGPEKKLFGPSLYLDPAYARTVRLVSTDPTNYEIGIITGRAADETEDLRERLKAVFVEPAARAGLDADSAVLVQRKDDGPNVRSASDGIKLVHAVISWGVLLISGLGLLVAELIVLRDRNWFFGLARALGARRGAVAALIFADIVLILAAGFGVALLIATGLAPAIAVFGQSAFHTDLQLIRPSAIVPLVLAAAAMLLLGGAYPAWRATRLDPLEVLERR